MSEPGIDDIVPVTHGWVAAVEAQLTSNGNLLGDVLKRLDALEHQARPLQEEFVPLTREQVNRNVEIIAERNEAVQRAEGAERERDEAIEQFKHFRDLNLAARAALAKYGRHMMICEASRHTITGCCTCGLTDALNASPA